MYLCNSVNLQEVFPKKKKKSVTSLTVCHEVFPAEFNIRFSSALSHPHRSCALHLTAFQYQFSHRVLSKFNEAYGGNGN
jgi:hypothetical protein